jgi:hypothetical protein
MDNNEMEVSKRKRVRRQREFQAMIYDGRVLGSVDSLSRSG